MSTPSPMSSADPRQAVASSWLPDFCSAPVVFAVTVVVELAVLAILIAPSDEAQPLVPRLGTATLFAQWLAMVCVVALCQLRPWLMRLAPSRALAVAYVLVLALVLVGSLLVSTIDVVLNLHMTLPGDLRPRFVLRNVALAALVTAALLRYFYVIEQWRARVRAEARARGDALQARIRPHFLFNSMNTIASLIRTDPRAAERAVEDLSDLFRAALGAEGKLSTLGEEFELARRYLAIEQLRLGERLRVEIDAADMPRDLPVPALLLQPLVENAVHHGVQPLPEGGTVTLRGCRAGSGAEVTITNPRPPEAQRLPPRHGMALANTRSRIEYHFGWRGALVVQQDEREFRVILRLPEDRRDANG